MSVQVECYLVIGQKFSPNGYTQGKPTIRTAKNKPHCAGHEVAIALNLILPNGLFQRPALEATICVPDGQAPVTITPEIEQNIADTLKEQFGIVLNISAPAADQS